MAIVEPTYTELQPVVPFAWGGDTKWVSYLGDEWGTLGVGWELLFEWRGPKRGAQGAADDFVFWLDGDLYGVGDKTSAVKKLKYKLTGSSAVAVIGTFNELPKMIQVGAYTDGEILTLEIYGKQSRVTNPMFAYVWKKYWHELLPNDTTNTELFPESPHIQSYELIF